MNFYFIRYENSFQILYLKVNLPIQNYCLKVNDTWHGITSRYIEFISEIKFIGLRASRRVISSAI